MKRKFSILLHFLILLALSACGITTASPSPVPSGMVDVGGYSLYYECSGQGSPTVILESGGTGDSSDWAEVIDGLEGTTRVCAYGRARLGRSDPDPGQGQEKIAMNAQRFAPASRSSANQGRALLSGLIECRRCHHKLQVHYDSQGRVTYFCQHGKRQRDRGAAGCIRLAGEELERQLSEQVLYAVSPAGVQAALLAGERLATERTTQRSILSDELERFQYEADLARRRFNNVDPANRLLPDTLASEVEAALQAVAEQEAKLARFDQDEPARPTPAEQAELQRLGSDLEAVWYAADADHRLKQQIVRELIEHVLADVDEARDESVLWLHWTGGHHTELRAPRRRRRGRQRERNLSEVLDTLRKIADDEEISRALNRAGIRTERGESWTRNRVTRYRERCGIAAYSAAAKSASGWLSQAEAATKLEISPMSLIRLIQRGILRSEGETRLPQVIQQADLSRKEVIQAVKQTKSHGNSPLPENPKQPFLFQ